MRGQLKTNNSFKEKVSLKGALLCTFCEGPPCIRSNGYLFLPKNVYNINYYCHDIGMMRTSQSTKMDHIVF